MTLSILIALACTKGGSEDSGYIDADGDGYSVDEGDCDDANELASPDGTETCDGVDNDCDGDIDNGVTITVYTDADGDGYGDQATWTDACEAGDGQSDNGDDCDDADIDVNPGATEDCTDERDLNCDGDTEWADEDADGVAACDDCDDTVDTTFPGADEVCDGADNDCDGDIDEDDAIDASTFYADLDEDGYGDLDNTWAACAAPSGFVADDTDCDDDDASVYPGAEEICDAKDSDCDGTIGEVLVPTLYGTVQAAIDAGETDICIEEGTYTENLVLDLESTDLRLAGVGSESVTLDAGDLDRAIDAYVASGTLTVSGMTITGGYATDAFAAGLYASSDSTGGLVLDDVVFNENVCESALCYGGVVSALNLLTVDVTDVELHDNTINGAAHGSFLGQGNVTTTIDGLSIHDESNVDEDGQSIGSHLMFHGLATLTDTVTLNDVEVYDNDASAGRTFSPVTFYQVGVVDGSNLSAHGNSGYSYNSGCGGGGFRTEVVETLMLSNVSIIGNSCETDHTTAYVNGLWVYTTYSGSDSAEITNLLIAGNTLTAPNATPIGGSFAHLGTATTVTNATITGNVTTSASAYADWSCYYGSQALNNVTYSGNTLTTDDEPTTGFDVIDSACATTWTYSNVYDQGATPYGTVYTDPVGVDGNLSVDPGFVDVADADPLNWDLTLDSGSALIDAGDPAITDDDGSNSDIGAYGGPGNADW